MIDLYYWPTPNGHKITMFLEEAGLEYQIIPVNISTGDQFKPAFLQISPNNRIADIAAYPWMVPWKRQGQNIDDFPHIKRWLDAIGKRPATVSAYEQGQPYSNQPAVTEEGKKLLFGQTAASIRAMASATK